MTTTPTTTTTPPPGIDPQRWAAASWHARARLLARLAREQPHDDPDADAAELTHRHPAACVNGHDLTQPGSWYAPQSRPHRRDCRECRRVRARIRQRARRAAERAARQTPTTMTEDRTAA